MKKKYNEPLPLVSVILPVYNAEKYITLSLKSIIHQSYKNLEIIVIDDCSTDNSFQILQDFCSKDNRIKLYQNDSNRGLIYTLNRLIRLSSGSYIARMDADDISLENRIETQLNLLLEDSTIAACGGQVILIDESNKKIGKKMYPSTSEDINSILAFDNPLCHPSVMFNIKVIENLSYSSKFIHAEDYALWCELVSKGYKLVNSNQFVLKYRVTSTGVSKTHTDIQLKNTVKIIKNFNLLPSLYIPCHAHVFYYQELSDSRITEEYFTFLYNTIKKLPYFDKKIILRKVLAFLKKSKTKNVNLLKLEYIFPIAGVFLDKGKEILLKKRR